MEVADIVEMLYLCRDNSFLDPLRIPSPTRLRVTKESHDFIDTFIGLPVGKWSASLGKHGAFFNFVFGVLVGIGIQVITFVLLNFFLNK